MWNLNYLPVRAKVLQVCNLGGRVVQPGEVVELQWIRFKFLEKEGVLERVYADMRANTDPVRDVMIFCPVYRLEPETVLALMQLEFDGAATLVLQRDNPESGPGAGVRNHLHQYQRGRELFLAGKYDAMLVIESDIIPPADTLTRLIALQADVAYGVYRFRGQANVVNVFERYPDSGGQQARNTGESLSVKPWLLREALRKGKYPCSGAGLGCVLIRREVLATVPFRLDGKANSFCDTPWTNEVYQYGYTMMADMGVVCGHKDTTGEMLWPKLPSLS